MLPHCSGVLLAESLRAALLLLAHRYPKIRKTAADLIYVHLLTYGDPGPLPPIPDPAEAAAAAEGDKTGEVEPVAAEPPD